MSKKKKDEERPVQKDILGALRETRETVESLRDYLTQARYEFRHLLRVSRPRPFMQMVNEMRPIRLIRRRILGQGDGGNDRAG